MIIGSNQVKFISSKPSLCIVDTNKHQNRYYKYVSVLVGIDVLIKLD